MILNELKNRGILSDVTGEDELSALINSGEKLTLYCGFDPTAESLHVGSLLPLMNLKRFADAGHNVIALIGGATGFIGDPSFKANERKLNTEEQINFFKKGITEQIIEILGENVTIVDNYDWTVKMNVIDFLRDIGKHFSVNAMMNKESVKQRLNREGSGMSFTEFSYQLLQGMDFLKLKEIHGCNLQIGGSDQMGNITAGINLIHKTMGSKEPAFGLTTKLLTKENGEKFGKSESGTVWLSKEKTSPFDFFQFWLKTTDSDVYNFLNFFSTMTPDEIAEIEVLDKNRKPEAQMLLAKEVTEMVHGKEGLEEALKVTNALVNGEFNDLTLKEMEMVMNAVPFIETECDSVDLIDMLVKTELASSRRQAREFLTNGSIKVNGVKKEVLDNEIRSNEIALNKADALCKSFIFIKRGKRNLACIHFTD